MADTVEFDVRIGKGLRPIAQHGKLQIQDGSVTLLDSRGGVVATAPVGRADARKNSFPLTGVRLELDGVKYTLDAPSPKGLKLGGRYASGAPMATVNLVPAVVAALQQAKSAQP